ncbi:MAG TPA: small, acid-soluble spore protein, alpha/beta type [Tissierellales bacterium]|nr:small, acid-soluble spore protein, alpha/beta type [Tissierellales bacterium]
MKNINPNARKGLEEFKVELSKELGLEDNIPNIFHAGKVGGLMTRNLVEMGQKNLINDENESEYKD